MTECGDSPADLPRPTRKRLVGVVMRGRDSDLPLARAAVDLAGEQPRGLVVFVVRPPVRVWAASEFGIDPDELRASVEMDERRSVGEILHGVGLKTKYSLTMIDRPNLRSMVKAAKREGCELLVAREPLVRRVARAALGDAAGDGGLELKLVRRGRSRLALSWTGLDSSNFASNSSKRDATGRQAPDRVSGGAPGSRFSPP